MQTFTYTICYRIFSQNDDMFTEGSWQSEGEAQRFLDSLPDDFTRNAFVEPVDEIVWS